MTIEITSVVISVPWWLVLLVALALFSRLKKIKRQTLRRFIEKLLKE